VHCLNLGCGDRYHPNWTNINFSSTNEGVISHDLRQGIPFPDRSFDVVYHSHVLEHFPKSEASKFLKECTRVLRPQGVLRIVVPDLEEIARVYLHSLKEASVNDPEWEKNYQWILLEMYDQTVRNKSGGEMIDFLSDSRLFNEEFVVKRCGVEIENIILSSQNASAVTTPVDKNKFRNLLKHLYRSVRYSDYRRQAILKFFLSPQELDALKIGQFRQSGEVHQWMYDRYSLSSLLKKYGFQNVTQQTASRSYIPNWTSFNLDTEIEGTIYKPDSLFMEAIKL